jgi:hypothetical protein
MPSCFRPRLASSTASAVEVADADDAAEEAEEHRLLRRLWHGGRQLPRGGEVVAGAARVRAWRARGGATAKPRAAAAAGGREWRATAERRIAFLPYIFSLFLGRAQVLTRRGLA